MGRASDLAAALDSGGLTSAAPTEQAFTGAADSRWVHPAHLVAAARAAKDAGFFYESMTCVDRLDPHGVFELVTTFSTYEEPGSRLALRTWIPKDAEAPSLTPVFGIAEWNEREAWEFFGLRFAGHPNLTWLLLPEDTEFRPLLKSFTAPPPSQFDDSLNTPAPAPADDAQHAQHG